MQNVRRMTMGAKAAPFQVVPEPPKMLTLNEELAVYRQAVEREPGSPEFRYRLAFQLHLLDHFDEATDLLRTLAADEDRFRAHQLLGLTLLARENDADTRAAEIAARRAVDLAESPHERSVALSLLGKAHLRLGETEAARATLHRALDENIHNKDAYKRLATLDMEQGNPGAALAMAEEMVAKGVLHARVLAAMSCALAKLGRIEEAREAFGFDRFLLETVLPPPPGWPSIEAFNADLAAELLAHPGIRYERYGTASALSWRIDDPRLARSRMVPLLDRLIQRAVEEHVAELGDGDHPWLRGRPPVAALHPWVVMTEGAGFEEWHVHQNGWLSGAYYVAVPDFILDGEGPEGCVGFGLPEGIVGDEAHRAFGTRMFRPRPGLLMTFPSHCFHRTFAHRGDRRRICLAFDVAPHEDRI